MIAIIGIVLYEQQPSWLIPNTLQPTPVPTRGAISYLSEAESFVMRSDFAGAIESLKEVSRLEPENPDPWVEQAELYMILRQVPDARQAAERAVELDPENPNALAQLARALDWQGQYEAASQYAFEGLDVDPENVTILAVLGEIYSDYRNWARAEVFLQSAYELDPQDVLVLRNLAYMEETRGEYAKAIEYFNQAIEVAPHRYDLLIERGRQESFGLNDYEAALASYEQAASIFESVETLDAYGYGLYNMGDNLAAVRVLRDAVEMDPKNGLAQVHLGMVYYALRNYEDSIAPLETGITILGEAARIENIYSLGLAHIYREPLENDDGEPIETEEEKCEKAVLWLQQAFEIEPTSLPVLEGLSLCGAR